MSKPRMLKGFRWVAAAVVLVSIGVVFDSALFSLAAIALAVIGVVLAEIDYRAKED